MTVAKLVGTAAVISGDRVHLGVGVGWCKEEFDATGQEFHDRGRRLDDMIPALRALWQDGWVEHHGPHYDFGPLQMRPVPAKPVPIYIGGHSDPALRRAAALGDGWIAAGAYDEDAAWHHLGRLREELARAGRADDPFTIYLALAVPPAADTYKRFEDAGVTDLVCRAVDAGEADEGARLPVRAGRQAARVRAVRDRRHRPHVTMRARR